MGACTWESMAAAFFTGTPRISLAEADAILRGRMRPSLETLLVLFFVSTLAGCKPEAPKPPIRRPPNGPVVGKWHAGVPAPRGIFLEFKKDGTFSFERYWTDVKGPKTSVAGTYRLEGDRLTVAALKTDISAPKGVNPKIIQYLRTLEEHAKQSGKGAADLNGTVAWHGKNAFILTPEGNLAMEFVRLPDRAINPGE